MDNSLSMYSAFWAVEITALVAICVMCVLIYTLRKNTLMLKQLRDESDSDANAWERFNGEQAEKWFEQGELNNLTNYCQAFIKQSPNSVHANWYFAVSHYNQGDYETAREYFEKVIHINPLWRDGAIVYLQEIAVKIGATGHPTVH